MSDGTRLEDRASYQENEYFRLLDSLARFYNSQITVHVGYELTVSVFVLGSAVGLLASVLLRSEQICFPQWLPFDTTVPSLWLDRIVRIIVFVLIFVGTPVYFFVDWIPYSFKYLFGRALFYNALSDIASEHMGLTDPREPVESRGRIHRMMNRALRNPEGIRMAIFTLFEARLLLSRYARVDQPVEELFDEQKVQEKNRSWVQQVRADLAREDTYDIGSDNQDLLNRNPSPYKKRTLWFNLEDTLYLAYRSSVDELCEENKYRGLLLRRAFDP